MKKEVKYTVTGEEWGKAKDKAFNKLNSKRKVDGFRQGKTPRNIFEKKFPGEIVMEAANELIDKKYREIITDKELRPVVEPQVNITKLDDENLEVNFVVITEPEVKLGEYKNLDVKKEAVKVTKKDIEERVNSLLKEYAELMIKEEGKVETGDIAIIDFEGFKDDVPFEGGKGENYSLEIGSNTFIPGFEDGVIGMNKGEAKDLKLTFPKDYGSSDLAGQEVVFKVTVNEIKTKVIPELDKDFFEDLGMEGVTNKEELEKKIKEDIKNEREKASDNKYIDELLKVAVDNMTCEIEDEIVKAEAEAMYNDLIERVQMQGLTEEIYLQYANTTKDDIIDHMKPDALRRLQNSYLLQAIIEKENITADEKEALEELEKMAKDYNMTVEDIKKSIGGIDAIIYDLKVRKVIELMKKENTK